MEIFPRYLTFGHPDSADKLTFLRAGITWFVRAKALIVALGIGLYLLTDTFQPDAGLVFLIVALVDGIGLIPYSIWARRNWSAATVGTYLTLSVSALGIALALLWTRQVNGAGVLIYFLLFPFAMLVLPTAQTGWNIAGIATVAYVGMLVGYASTLAVPEPNERLVAWILPPLMIASFWAMAFAWRQLFVWQEQASREYHWRLEQAQRLAEAESIWDTIGKTITTKQDLAQVLGNVLQLIDRKIGLETGAILLLDPAADELYFASALQFHKPINVPVRLAVGKGIAGWVAAHRQSQMVNDTRQDARWDSQMDAPSGFNTRAVLAVPLLVHEQVIGIVELISEKPNAFAPEDMRFLELIAAPIAVSIQNARLHSQVRAQLAEMSALLSKVTRAKNEWEQTVDAIGAGIALMDNECRILRANRTLADWLGTDPPKLVGECYYRAIEVCDKPAVECPHCLARHDFEAHSEHEFEIPRFGKTIRQNTYALHDQDDAVLGSVNVMQDVTAAKALQVQLVQSEKLAAIGRLAASLAHEINNPLQAIQGCLDLAQANPHDVLKQERYLTMAKGEVDRLATMVQRILDFYRPAKGTRTPTDVQTLVTEVLALSAKRLQQSRTVVRMEWAEPLPLIQAAANQLKQVFLNLMLNASDAMPNGGELTIRGRREEQDGKWIVLEFIDTGVGIPPEDVDKIFEPFYTTKSQGTGLGLGVTHNIITNHGGQLSVVSVPGKGSTFTVRLPV